MSIPTDKLQCILDEATSSGEECGLQLAIYQNGKLAADLCSGYTNGSRSEKVTTKSLFPLFSSGKAVMATAFHMLKEEIKFDYNEKVSRYWPEYGCNGKEDTRIIDILSHRSGVHVLPGVGNTSDDLADWNGMCRRVQEAAPAWTPGTKCGYQSITFAWLLGELAFRISSIPFQKYIFERIIKPLGIEKDFFFGITDDVESRVVEIDSGAFSAGNVFTADFHGNHNIRRAFIPSANGIATAAAAAKIFNDICHGKQFLSPETIENATQLCRHPDNPIQPGEWSKFGLGYVLPDWENSCGDIFGHGGAAGAELLFCKSRDMALCFVKNRPIPEHPKHPVRDRIADALELPRLVW